MLRLITAILVAVSAFIFTGCADGGAPKHEIDYSGANHAISASVMEQKLEEFMNGREDRTSFTKWESAAADYLYETLVSYGYDDARIEEITVTDGKSATRLESQNVIAAHKSASDGAKNVVIGAYYDNWYSTPYKGAAAGTKGDGALSNGTGVATLLAVAEYLKSENIKLGFDVSIVFFGASATTVTGASYYYEEHMTAAERRNTVLMIELQRLGGDHIYAFSDARKTKREGFFDGIASANGLDIYKPTQKSPVMTMAYSLDGIPYLQWAHTGVYSVFFNKSVPTLNLVGGNWETIDMTDAEFADRSSVSFTKNDNMEVLKEYCPDYGDKMATAATLVIKSLTNGEFLETMVYDKENFPDTDILLKQWIWYLIAFAVAMIAAFAMSLVNRRLAKKYPISAPRQPQQMKMAVFGMEYEDKSSGDIFIDIKKVSTEADEIFPGIPNNDNTRSGGNLDPIFPMYVEPLRQASKPTEKEAGIKEADKEVDEVFPPRDEKDVKEDDRSDVSVVEKTDDGTENDKNNSSDNADAADVDSVKNNAETKIDASAAEESPKVMTEEPAVCANVKKPRAAEKAERKPTPAKRTSATARKTVSAGKSTSAKKTTRKTEERSEGEVDADKE